MTSGGNHGRKARGASGAGVVISLIFLSGVGQAVGSHAGGLGASAPSSRHTARVLAHAPACAPARPAVHFYAPGAGRTVALTFDDGPGPSTKAILAILADERVPATFFNLGTSEQLRPSLVIHEANGGYAVGNHTWDHTVLPVLSDDAQAAELDRESAEQVMITGGRPCLFRPPYGSYDAATLDASVAARMALWNWSVDTEDWKAQGSGSSYWVHRIISRAEAGASQPHPVILMHNQLTPNPATVAALRPVIHFYREHGYTFVDLYGRTTLAPVVSAARTLSGLHVMRVGPDGALQVANRTSSGWSRWAPAGPRFTGGVASVGRSPRAIAVAGTGSDHHVHIRWAGQGRLGHWTRIGGSAVGRPALTRLPGGRLALVVRGTDDAVWLREWTHGRWHRWRSLGGHVISDPAVTSIGDDGLMVVGTDTNGALIERRRRGASWGQWRRIGGAADGDPALAPLPGVGAVLATRSETGAVAVRLVRPVGDAGRWRTVVGALASAPTVLVDGGKVRLFGVRRSDGAVVENVGTSRLTRWSGWRRVGR